MLPINIPINEFDKSLLLFVNHFHTPILDKLIVCLSNIGEYAIIWIIIGIALALLDKKNAKRFLLALVIALILELILNDGIIRHVFFRERPYIALLNVYHLGPNWINSSFVSGHTASSVASLIVIGSYYQKMIAPCAIIALIMIYTRFYLGMHYPTDILGGIIIGTLAGYTSIKLISNSKL